MPWLGSIALFGLVKPLVIILSFGNGKGRVSKLVGNKVVDYILGNGFASYQNLLRA